MASETATSPMASDSILPPPSKGPTDKEILANPFVYCMGGLKELLANPNPSFLDITAALATGICVMLESIRLELHTLNDQTEWMVNDVKN